MLEKRSVEAPDVGDLGSADNPGETEKKATKKGSSRLVWLALPALGVLGYYLWRRKKAEAAAIATQEELARQDEEKQRQASLGKRVTLTEEEIPNVGERFEALGENPEWTGERFTK